MVCEVMIQGIRLRSRLSTWMIAAASVTPRRVPMTKPSMVEESVIPP